MSVRAGSRPTAGGKNGGFVDRLNGAIDQRACNRVPVGGRTGARPGIGYGKGYSHVR